MMVPTQKIGSNRESKIILKKKKDTIRKMFKSKMQKKKSDESKEKQDVRKKVKEEKPRKPEAPVIRKDEKIPERSRESVTVFEIIQDSRPAIAGMKEGKLRWKDDIKDLPKEVDPKNEDRKNCETPEKDEFDPPKASESQSAEMLNLTKDPKFFVACRVMSQVRQNNMLESVLMSDENFVLRKFFENGMDPISSQVISLLQKAMEKCYHQLMFEQNQLELYFDDEMREFLLDSTNAIIRLLDAVLSISDFLPLMWGGKSVAPLLYDDRDEVAVLVQQTLAAEKKNFHRPRTPTPNPSPWTSMMQIALEDERKNEMDARKTKNKGKKESNREPKAKHSHPVNVLDETKKTH